MEKPSTQKSGAIETVSSDSNAASTPIDLDELQLRAQGHVGELPRQFSTFSMLALTFSVTNTWIAYAATFMPAAAGGAAPGVIWALVVACIACTIIMVGLAELASAFPSSGGQYHYAFMVASARWRAPVAFVTGWLSVFGWVFTTASCNIFVAQSAVSLAAYAHPSYQSTQWQVWLAYTLCTITSTAIVIFMPKQLPRVTTVLFLGSILGIIVAFITMLSVSKHKAPGNYVFVQWQNLTGWPDGLAFLLGVGQAMYGFSCIDGATHLAEEIPSPGRHVPQVMCLTPLIGILTTLPYTLAFLFSSTDIAAATLSALPILNVYEQAVVNNGLAVFLAAWVCFLYWGASIGLTVTSGRLIWAFARDSGVPFSKTFAKIHPTLQMPLNATILTSIFVIIYGLIYIGSTAAFYSFISTAILALNLSYAAPQAVLLCRWRQRKQILPTRYLNLGGVVGPICNAWSVAWVSLYLVVFCFPYSSETTPGSMNYVSIVISATLLFIGCMWWFAGKRKTFVGPNVEADILQVLGMAS